MISVIRKEYSYGKTLCMPAPCIQVMKRFWKMPSKRQKTNLFVCEITQVLSCGVGIMKTMKVGTIGVGKMVRRKPKKTKYGETT